MAKTTKKTTAKGTAPAVALAKKTATKKATPKKTAAKTAPVKKAGVTKKVGVTKKAVAKKAPAKKGAGVAARPAATRSISAADRRQMIAEAAYLRGESRGFISDEREDWLLAEAEVDAMLAKARVAVSD